MSSTPCIQRQELSYQTAMELAALVAQYAQQQTLTICLVIVNPHGRILVSMNMNTAPLHSSQIALDKAYTSASFGLESHAWHDRLATQPHVLAALNQQPLFTALGGGAPLRLHNRLVGAIGISGAKEAQDIDCAQFAIRALNTLL